MKFKQKKIKYQKIVLRVNLTAHKSKIAFQNRHNFMRYSKKTQKAILGIIMLLGLNMNRIQWMSDSCKSHNTGMLTVRAVVINIFFFFVEL